MSTYMSRDLFCKNPWNCLELNNDGKCFFCNPCFSNFALSGRSFKKILYNKGRRKKLSVLVFYFLFS